MVKKRQFILYILVYTHKISINEQIIGKRGNPQFTHFGGRSRPNSFLDPRKISGHSSIDAWAVDCSASDSKRCDANHRIHAIETAIRMDDLQWTTRVTLQRN